MPNTRSWYEMTFSIKDLARRLSEEFYEKYSIKPVISISGSGAALYNPNLFGNGVYRSLDSIVRDANIDIVVFHPYTPKKHVSWSTSISKNISVWYYDMESMLITPAAAYALHDGSAYILVEGDSEANKIRNIVNNTINSSFPKNLREILSDNLYNKVIDTINLNLKIGAARAHKDLVYRLKTGVAEIHDLFKFVGAVAASNVFNDEKCIIY